MGHFFHLYPAPYIELYLCYPIQISYLKFKEVLALPKMACSAQTHKSISFIWTVWSTLYVYLCLFLTLAWNLAAISRKTEPPPSELLAISIDILDLFLLLWSTMLVSESSDSSESLNNPGTLFSSTLVSFSSESSIDFRA